SISFARALPDGVYGIHLQGSPPRRVPSCRGPSSLIAHVIVFTECTWITTLWGSTACIAVSIDAPGAPADVASVSGMARPSRTHRFALANPTVTKKSSASAWASHLPDALIHSESPILMEIFPVLAWTKSGLRARRTESFRRAINSRCSLGASVIRKFSTVNVTHVIAEFFARPLQPDSI